MEIGLIILQVNRFLISFKSQDDIANPPQLFGSGEVNVITDERQPADRIDLANDVHARVLWIDAHQHAPASNFKFARQASAFLVSAILSW